jgi:acyl-CoA thioesterase-1
MLQRFVGVLVLVAVSNAWLPVSTWAQEPSKAQLPSKSPAPVILVLGDSLSSGYGIPTAKTWVALLQRRLNKLDYPHRIVNASVSGDTTASGLSRLNSALQRHDPSIVILELGGNDGLRALSLAALRSNLESIIKTTREGDAKIVLAGMRIPPNYGVAYTTKFERIYTELASQYQVVLIPFFLEGVATVPNMMQDDGIHPTVDAQPVLLENVWKHVHPLL